MKYWVISGNLNSKDNTRGTDQMSTLAVIDNGYDGQIVMKRFMEAYPKSYLELEVVHNNLLDI